MYFLAQKADSYPSLRDADASSQSPVAAAWRDRSRRQAPRDLRSARNPASRNQLRIGGKPARYDSPTIMVGSAEAYEALCRGCHSVPRRDEDQGRLL